MISFVCLYLMLVLYLKQTGMIFVCLCLMLAFETNGCDTLWPRLVRCAKATKGVS